MTGALFFLGAWLVLILLWGRLGERPVAPAGRAPNQRRQP